MFQMNFLVIHPNFPGQFRHLVPRLLNRGDRVCVIQKTQKHKRKFVHDRFQQLSYSLQRGNGKDTHPLVLETESKTIRAEAVAMEALVLKKQNFRPDLIIGHPGWGDMLFLSDIWPDVSQLHYLEHFYGVPGTDNDFDDEYATNRDFNEKVRTRMKNANLLLNLNQMTSGLSPTYFQRSLLPVWSQSKTTVIHDGINTEWLIPDPNSSLRLSNGLKINAGDPVITFVNRTFEPYRGIHVFLKALSEVQIKHPTVQTLLVGADIPNVSYGASRTDGRGWLTALKDDIYYDLDWTRIHSLGTIPHKMLRKVYQISSAHVYLSYPFVLSWSLLEAMSCGCLIIGSDTAPVKEVIQDGINGLLVPFQKPREQAKAILRALENREDIQLIRNKARTSMDNYSLPKCLSKQLSLLDSLVA